jgi:hypothetical protein
MENTSNNSTEGRFQDLSDMGHKLRLHAIKMTDVSGSGY